MKKIIYHPDGQPSSFFNKKVISVLLIFLVFLFLAGFASGAIAVNKNLLPFLSSGEKVSTAPNPLNATSTHALNAKSKMNNALGSIMFNIPAFFNNKVEINANLLVTKAATFTDNITVKDKNLTLGKGKLTASNVLYGLTAGANITISGDKQNPVISATQPVIPPFPAIPPSVTSLQGQQGELKLAAGSGIGVDGLEISNSDPGSSQNIFKNVIAGSSAFSADSNEDTLTFAAGTGMTITTDTANKMITFAASVASDSGVLSVTGTANQINASAPTGHITLTLPQDINTTSAPTFNSLQLASNTNQVTLGSGNTGTLTMAPLSTGRTYTLPDASGTFCLTTGNCSGVGGSVAGSGTVGQIAFFNANNSITSEATGFAWDASNDKFGIGNDTPTGKFDVNGKVTGKALAIFNETGNQDILTASSSGTTRFVISNTGNLTAGTYNGNTITPGSGTLTLGAGKTLTANNSLAFSGTDGTTFTFPGSSGTVATLDATQILTNKTIAAGSNTITGLTNANLSGTAGITNANLANSSVTINSGAGLSGGGTVSLGSAIALTNTGVTSAIAGTGISLSGGTGAVTITNTGVTSLAGTLNQVNVSGPTGAVTLTLPQDINSSANPTFAAINLTNNTNQLVLGTTNTGTITMNPLGAPRTYSLPDASGTICLSGQTCASSGTLGYLTRNTTTLTPSTLSDRLLLTDGATTDSSNFRLEVNGKQTGKALVALNETGNQDILTASSSGTTRFTISNTGNLTAGTYNGNTITPSTGTLTLGAGKTLTANNSLTFVGTDGTTLTFQGTDTYVGRTTTDTLTNKTLTAPRLADLGFLADPSGNEYLILDSVASAVNEITIANAATGNGPTLAATGGDPNVPFSLDAKGTGALNLNNTGTGNILLGGGSGSTGCTVTNATGAFACTAAITGSNISGTNTGDVTLSGENYLSIAGQAITANAVNLSGTNVAGTLAAARFGTLTGDVTSAGGSYATTIAADAVTTGKILDNTVTASDLNPTLTFASGDYLDLSAITHNTTALQGLRLPNTNGTPSNPSSGEGFLAYDTVNDVVKFYNGSSWVQVSSGANGSKWTLNGNVIYPNTISNQVGIGTQIPGEVTSSLYVTHDLASGALGKAVAIFNQTENQDLLSASSSGTTRFIVGNTGNVTAGTYNGNTITQGSGTLTLGAGKTLTANNSLTFAGTDATTITFQGTDTYVGRGTTDTLTNKTLTAPKFADLGFLADPSGNEFLILDSVASAVNEVTLGNAATGNGPTLAATGGDPNVPLSVDAKGTGALNINNTGTGNILLGGGSASTGCTVTNATGAFACTGAITGSNFSGSNTGDVTLTGENYLSIAGQAITANAVNLSGTNVAGTLAAARFGTLTGDVTSPGGSYATTIAADAVTSGKILNNTIDFADIANSLTLDANTSASFGDNVLTLGDTTGNGNLVVAPRAGGQAALIVNKQGTNDIFSASASGTTKFTISNSGNLGIAGSTVSGNNYITAPNFALNTSGQISTGTWQATAIGSQYGGTGQNFSGSTGVPSISSGTWSVNAQTPLSLGGTNANLTADNGGILYSGASALAILAHNANAGLALVSGGAAAPTWFAPTQGSILFAAANGALTENNGSFFWDNTNNRLGIGTTSPFSTLDVRSSNGTTPAASVSANSTFAAMVVDNNDGGDLFTASKSGASKFTILNNGNIQMNNYNGLNAVLYGTQTTGVLAQATTASSNQCLISGASTPTWGSCAAGASTFNQFNGIITQANTSTDFAIGGTSTASAQFSVTGMNGGVGALQKFVTESAAQSLSVGRDGHTSVVANGYVYVIGGENGTSGSAQTGVYYAKLNADGSTGTWTTNANALPVPLTYHSSVTANGYVYVMGGFDSTTKSGVYYAKLNADGSIGTWITGNSLPGIRDSHTSVVANGYVYVIGGWNGAALDTTAYAKLNADGSIGAWQTSGQLLPNARLSHGSVVANGYVYVMGGGTGGTPATTVYYTKLNTDGSIGAWQTNGQNLPAGRNNFGMVVANGYVYVLGGHNGSTFNTVFYAKLNADGSTGAFQTNTYTLPAVRDNVTSVVVNGYVYVIGGVDNAGTAQTSIYYASTARMSFDGNLDLIGLQGGSLASASANGSLGSVGGSIYAGNIFSNGSLEITGNALFQNGAYIRDNLTADNLAVNGNIIASSAPTAGSTSQTTTSIDTTNDTGKFNSIKIGSDGLPIISYYDTTSTALKLLHCTTADCSSSSVQLVDGVASCPSGCSTTASAGQYSSLAISADGFPIISYYDATGGALDLKIVKCGNATCSSGNTYQTIDTAIDSGQYSSIAIGADGLPVISYYDNTNKNLKVAACTTAACSSSTITTIDSTGDVGQYSQIAISVTGFPVIAYYEGGACNNTSTCNPKVALCLTLSCTASTLNRVDNTTSNSDDNGQYMSMAILPNGTMSLSYFDNSTQKLQNTTCVSLSCFTWSSTTTDLSTNTGQYASTTVGKDGLAFISYYDATAGDLKIAKCETIAAGTASTNPFSTCAANNSQTSLIKAVDTTGNVGQYTSATLGTDGLPIISYYDVTNGDLKVLKCADADCANSSGAVLSGGSDIGSNSQFFNNVYAANYWGKSFQITNFDVAEDYKVEDTTIAAGDVVRIKKEQQGLDQLGRGATVEKTDKEYDPAVLGVVSTNPAIRLGDWSGVDRSTLRPIALTGRVPVKIAASSSPITAGDNLTASAEPGRAMKAERTGDVIGKALESWTPESGKETIQAFINTSYADSSPAMTADGNISPDLLPVTAASLNLPSIGVASSSAHFALNTDLQTLSATVSAIRSQTDIHESQLSDLNSKIASMEAKLAHYDMVTLGSNTEGLSYDESSGEISPLNAKLSSLTDRIATLEAQTNISPLTSTLSPLAASSSAQLGLDQLDIKNAAVSDTLSVLGRTVLSDVGITGKVNIGLLAIDGITGDGFATINTTSGSLKLQSDGYNGIDLLNGKVTIDTKGNVNTTGEITAGKININTENTLSASAGVAKLQAGEKQITIPTTAVTDKSLINITFADDYSPAIRYWIDKKVAHKSFILKLDAPTAKDADFTWWVVN